MDEQKILTIMKNLDCNRAQAISVLQADTEIDNGAKLYELNKEQKQNAKLAKQADRKAQTQPIKKEKKKNADKQELLEILKNSISTIGEDVIVANDEREFSFKYNGTLYKVVMSAPRVK